MTGVLYVKIMCGFYGSVVYGSCGVGDGRAGCAFFGQNL